MTTRASPRIVALPPALEPVAVAVLALLAVPLALLAAARPGLVLVAVGVLGVVALCTARVELAVLLLVATAPIESIFVPLEGSQLSITKVVGALAFASFALNAIATRRRLFFDAAHLLIFGLLALSMISTLQAQNVPEAVATTTRYASFVALFFVVSQFVGDHAFLRRIAWVLSISSAIAGALASWNFLSGQTLSARLPNGDPNDIAFILATTLPFTFWLLRETGPRRLAALGMTAVISVSILLTLSRGALVGLGAGLLWLALVERRHLKAIVAGTVAAAVVLAIVAHVEPSRLESGLRAKEKVASANVASRLEAWRAAADLAVDRPLLGVGPGNYRFHYLEETGRPPGTPRLSVVHDAYLDIASELGILAMLLFLAYLGTTITRLTTAVRQGLGPPGFASAARTALVIGIFAAITLSEQYFAPFWLLGAMATALWHEREPAEPERATALA